MQLSTDRLLEGMINTLEQVILPEVSSTYVRGQVFAVIDILNNFTGKVELRSDLLAKDIGDTKEVLEKVRQTLSDAEQLEGSEATGALVSKIDHELNREEDTSVPLIEHRKALNALLEEIMVSLDGCEQQIEEARRLKALEVIRTHLRSWLFKEVLALKPSMVRKMSKG